MTAYVQFDSDGEEKVIAVFGSPQDPESWDNYSEIDEGDERLQVFLKNLQGE